MRFLSTFAAGLLFATAAQAHSGDATAPGLSHDALHAVGGADHGLALLGVGLLVVLIVGAPVIASKLAQRHGRAAAPAKRRGR